MPFFSLSDFIALYSTCLWLLEKNKKDRMTTTGSSFNKKTPKRYCPQGTADGPGRSIMPGESYYRYCLNGSSSTGA